MLPGESSPSLDAILVRACLDIAQNALGFSLAFDSQSSDLSYSPPANGPSTNSLTPYRTFKYSLYMRESSAISRKYYMIDMYSKSHFSISIAICALLFLLLFIMKLKGLWRYVSPNAIMAIYTVIVSNGAGITASASVAFKFMLLVFSLINMIEWTAIGAFLTVEQVMRPVRKPFKSLHELIELGTIDLCVQPESLIFRYILDTERDAGVKDVLNRGECPNELRSTQDKADKFCEMRDRIAFVDGNNFATRYYSSGRSYFACKIVKVVTNIHSYPVALRYRPGFPFREDFNRL